jgi:hypothetical protein
VGLSLVSTRCGVCCCIQGLRILIGRLEEIPGVRSALILILVLQLALPCEEVYFVLYMCLCQPAVSRRYAVTVYFVLYMRFVNQPFRDYSRSCDGHSVHVSSSISRFETTVDSATVILYISGR